MIGDKIKGIGEVVLRVNNIELMKNFYQNTLGLKLIKDVEEYKFFKIAEGYGGHDQVIALFSKTNLNAFNESLGNINAYNSPLHHLAFEIDSNDFNTIKKTLEDKNIPYQTEVFQWVKWKSIFIKDPEENVVEFVCYDNEIQ